MHQVRAGVLPEHPPVLHWIGTAMLMPTVAGSNNLQDKGISVGLLRTKYCSGCPLYPRESDTKNPLGRVDNQDPLVISVCNHWSRRSWPSNAPSDTDMLRVRPPFAHPVLPLHVSAVFGPLCK